MNSTLQAKLHYDGKPHQKKVSMFLNQSVKKQKTEDGMLSNTTNKDWQNYCDVRNFVTVSIIYPFTYTFVLISPRIQFHIDRYAKRGLPRKQMPRNIMQVKSISGLQTVGHVQGI